MNVLRLVRLPRCQHGFEGGLANRDAAACELGMGAMAAGTSVRRRPLMDRRTFATSHISQGDHGTSQLMSPPHAHVVRVKALCKSGRSIIRLYTPTGTDDWRVISCPFHLRLNLIMSFPWHATANTNSQPRSHTALRTAGHRTARGFLRFCGFAGSLPLRYSALRLTTHLSPTSDQVRANFAQAINTHVSL